MRSLLCPVVMSKLVMDKHKRRVQGFSDADRRHQRRGLWRCGAGGKLKGKAREHASENEKV